MTIDSQLAEAGWLVRSRDQMNLATGIGPADQAMFVNRTLCGVLEAKPDRTTLSGVSDKSGTVHRQRPATACPSGRASSFRICSLQHRDSIS
jgi:type I restriction enzyme R subunit